MSVVTAQITDEGGVRLTLTLDRDNVVGGFSWHGPNGEDLELHRSTYAEAIEAVYAAYALLDWDLELEVVPVVWVTQFTDFPNRDESYRLGRVPVGRGVFAWGGDYPYIDGLPALPVQDGESGFSYHPTFAAAQDAAFAAIEAALRQDERVRQALADWEYHNSEHLNERRDPGEWEHGPAWLLQVDWDAGDISILIYCALDDGTDAGCGLDERLRIHP